MIYSDCLFRQFLIFILPAFALLLIARLYIIRVGYSWSLRSLAFLNMPEKTKSVLFSGEISDSLLIVAFVFIFIGSFFWCSVNFNVISITLLITLVVSLATLIFAYLCVASYISHASLYWEMLYTSERDWGNFQL